MEDKQKEIKLIYARLWAKINELIGKQRTIVEKTISDRDQRRILKIKKDLGI